MSLASCRGGEAINSRKTRRELNVSSRGHGCGGISGHRLGRVLQHREDEGTCRQQDRNAQSSHHGPHRRDRWGCVEQNLARSLVPAAFSPWQMGVIQKRVGGS